MNRFDIMVRDRTNDHLGLFEKYDEILCEVRDRIKKYNAKTVLDIGCGTGNLCGELSDTIDVLGLDKSLEMIQYAKEKYSNMSFKLGNFLDKPFTLHTFDIVVTTYAFHGLNNDDKKKAIHNMLDYLNTDGKIIIADFMFLNNSEREKCKIKFCSEGKQNLWDVVENKYYTNLEWLNEYVASLGYNLFCEHIVNFSWIIEIRKV